MKQPAGHDHPIIEVYLDAAEVEKRRRSRAERYNTVTVPVLRLVGFQLIACLVVLHNVLAPGTPEWGAVVRFVVAAELYCVVGWLGLRRFYRLAPQALPLAALALDVLVFIGAIYVTGADKSWLFPIVFMHVADQTATTFKRVLAFAHWAVFCYLGMIVMLVAQGAAIDWNVEMVKIALLYFMGVYTSFTARTAERLRDRLVDTGRTSRDLVAQLEQSATETQHALELSQVASRSKSEFLANMSHELRTPLNSVIGFSDVLLKNRKNHFDESELGYLRRIKDNGAHLLTIISDILDLSRIEAGRLDVELTDVDLRHLVTEVVSSFSGAARGSVEVGIDVPLVLESVSTDPTRLRQVLTNLVGNALKFTEEGSVRVRILARGERPHAIEVIDTGIGIPPERLVEVFRPFEQADNTTRRRFGGTGLGLSISRSLCDLMGYRLEADSEPGRGSVFRVVLEKGGA